MQRIEENFRDAHLTELASHLSAVGLTARYDKRDGAVLVVTGKSPTGEKNRAALLHLGLIGNVSTTSEEAHALILSHVINSIHPIPLGKKAENNQKYEIGTAQGKLTVRINWI